MDFSPLIIKGMNQAILGIDVIMQNPKILIENLKKLSNFRTQQESISTMSKRNIIENFKDIFKTKIDEFSICNVGSHSIKILSETPIFTRNGRIPVAQEEVIEREIEKNFKLGIIRPSISPWCSRIVMVKKPNGTWRICVDYRKLNEITIRDRYTSPRIDEIYDTLRDAKIFSILDATSGYYQIAMDESDKEKTAFSFRGKLYEFNRMPFGLCNAPASFQRAVDQIFREENRKFVIPYLDDIIIFSKSMKDHEKHLEIVLGKIKAAGLSLNEGKCKFLKTEIKILGSIVMKGKIEIDKERLRK